jgi:hypothetical protein
MEQQVMDVMLIENRPGAGDPSAAALVAAGHRVHRCHDHTEDAFPCRGVIDDSACPLSRGAQVALLVRQGVTPRPTAFEQGVHCALRAGLPVVEEGAAVLDPYGPWLAGRADGDPVGACARAVDGAFAPLHAELAAATSDVITDDGADPADVAWRVESTPERLHLLATGPDLSPAARSRLAVRALDVVRRRGPAHQRADVSYGPPED